MTKQVILTNADVRVLAYNAAKRIRGAGIRSKIEGVSPTLHVYGVPRGGIAAAMALRPFMRVELVDDPGEADFIFDDLIDSGTTYMNYKASHPETRFFTLIDKNDLPPNHIYRGWVVFPWERAESPQGEPRDTGSIEDNITRLLQYFGEDTRREGLKETPARVAKAWNFWCSGYEQKPEDVLKVFEDGGTGYDEMILVRGIPLYSKCEHHMADIFGTVTIGYIPNGRIVGLSKLSRLANIFARRLQVQERLTVQIADALFHSELKPKGVGVIVRARHMCMESRGLCQQGHHTVTSALRGVIWQGEPRAEFLKLAS